MTGTSAPGSFGTLATALPLLLVLLIVVRFAFRELRERTVRIATIWIRPALLLALSAYLVVLTLRVDPGEGAIMASAVLIGALLGLVTGVAVIRNTTFAAAGVPNAVRVRGNRITLAIWLAAFLVRLLARFIYPGFGDPVAQLPLNCGTVALVSVAFVVIAAEFHRQIVRLQPH
jgi:hypothetical protein